MMQCPCCGSKIDAPELSVESVSDIRMTPKQRKIVGKMLETYPRPVSTDALVDLIYGADPEGGPLTVRNVLAVQICRVRTALEPYGWTVPKTRRGRGHAGMYRLEKIKGTEQ